MGRFFFKCSKAQGEQCNYFQWADEPIQPAQQGGTNGSEPPAVAGPPCQCGMPSTQLTVRKEGPNTGRLFFACGRGQGQRCDYFQWADEPPRQEGHGGNGVGGGQAAATGPPCACGIPSLQLTVRKEGPNTGRLFYKCGKPDAQARCNYFQWADEPIQPPGSGGGGGGNNGQPSVAGPPCQCGQPSAQLTVRKEGPNTGRMFYGCAQPQRCNYFQWADEPAPQGQGAPQGGNFSGPPAAAGPPCTCGLPSLQLTVRKEGPNKGRQFYKCGGPQGGQNCDYFQWADEPIATPARNSGGSKGKGRGDRKSVV